MSRFQIGEFWLSQQARSEQWCRTWYDRRSGQTRRASLGTRDFEQAKVALAEWYVRNAELKNERPEDLPISAVLDRYYAQHASLLPSRTTQKRAIALWQEFWTDATVDQLTVLRQKEFVQWMRDRKYSDGYIRRTVGVGKAALNRAYHHQEVREVPFIKLDPVDASFDRVASVAQLSAFLNAIPPELDRVWVYALIRLNTACRGDAARDLQPFQVDFANNLVRLNPEGRKQTKKRRPVVPLTRTLAAVLRAQKPEAFYVNWHGRRVTGLRRAWAQARKAAGLGDWFIPKVLRHTAATELRRRGVPGWEASGMLGHRKSEAESTTEIYAKYDPAFLSKARDAIDSWMGEIAAQVPRLAALTRNSHVEAKNA